MVVDGQTGLLVPPDKPDQLAQAILRVLKDPLLAARMGEAGRKRVEQNFTVERMVKRTESLFLKLLVEKGINIAATGGTPFTQDL